jgi:hypothetical protein
MQYIVNIANTECITLLNQISITKHKNEGIRLTFVKYVM